MSENPATNTTTESNFENILIDRFFNPRSYFLNSFLNSLRQKEGMGLESGHVVAVGLLMDEIVNSDDKAALMDQLDTYSAFSRYHEQLRQGIEYLQNSSLSTQQMMEIVGSLGSSFADTLIDLISNDGVRTQLFGTLGIESGNLENVLKKEDSVQDEFAAIIQEVDNSKSTGSDSGYVPAAEVSSESPQEISLQSTEPEIRLEDQFKLDLSDLTENTADTVGVIPTEGGSPSPPLKSPFSSEETQSFKSGDFMAEVQSGDSKVEPWSHFQNDVSEKLQNLEENLKKFSFEPDNWNWFKGIKKDFRDLRDWAMIQGDEGMEALSHKILLLIETVYLRGSDHRFAIFGTLTNVIDALHVLNRAGRGSERLDVVRLVVNQIERQKQIYPRAFSFQKQGRAEHYKQDTPTITEPVNNQDVAETYLIDDQEIDSKGLEQLDSLGSETGIEASSAPQPPEVEEVYKFSDSEEHTPQDSLTLEPEIKIVKSKRSAEPDGNPAASSNEGEDSSWNIPGEADQDLMEILDHIKTEVNDINSGLMKTGVTPDKIEKSDNDRKMAELRESKTPQKGSSEPIGSKNDPAIHKAGEEKRDSGNGFDYVTEADMYFSFSRRALQDLMRNPSKKQALEDCELAFYSLRVLAQRLNYHIINDIMTFSEKLVQSKLQNKKALTTAQVNSLYTIISEIEQACRERKLDDTSRMSWLQQQSQVLKKWVVSRDTVTAQIEPMTTMSGHEGKSDDDPLDFLLFDDTSKFFKQLLKE